MDAIFVFRRLLLVTVALSVWSFDVARCCGGASNLFGNMTKDYDILVGSPLTVQCTLFSHLIKEDHTEYYVTSENLFIKFDNINLENLVVIDEYTVEYSIDNATINDTGIYTCYLSLPDRQNPPFVCTTYIAVGFEPLPVENFSCVSMHYANLTCSWTEPFNPVKTVYNLFDYMQMIRLKRQCPVVLNSTSCQWRLDTKPPYMKSPKTLYFFLEGNNSLGSNRQFMSVEHFTIVKPAEPSQVRFTNITERSMVIHWLPPKGMEFGEFQPGLLYSIKYRPLSSHRKQYKEVTTSTRYNGSYRIEDLIPYTMYELKIRCRSTKAESEDMWSPTLNFTYGTLPDVPYLAPELVDSSFEVQSIVGNRTITLYWKAVPAEFANGDNFTYEIKYHIHYVPPRLKRENSIVVVNKTYFAFKDMDLNSAYLFKIYAKNSIGPSANSSQIVVDKASKLLSGPKDIAALSFGRGKYTISWERTTRNPTNFTLFWCKSLNPRPFQCEGPLQWLYTTEMHHSLDLLDKETAYQFAIAAVADGQTSGMVWASCVISYADANYKVKKVELLPRNATSLKVQWSLDCDSQRTVILQYAIHYCEIDGPCDKNNITGTCENGWTEIVVTNVSLHEYNVEFLTPHTCYQAFVRAQTLSGWSENSNIAQESTLSAAPSDPPQNVTVQSVNGTIINLSFRPPLIPNGVITHYIVYYGIDNSIKHSKDILATDFQGSVQLHKAVFHYTNYSITVKACVSESCSKLSMPVYAFTGITYPGMVNSPRVEIVDTAFVNVTWDPPAAPNGPVDTYEIIRSWKMANETEKNQVFTVNGTENYLLVKQECSEDVDEKTVFHFRVRAINIKDGIPLTGKYSKPTKTMLCSSAEPSYGLVIGVTIGCVGGFLVLVIVIYSFASWMKNEVDMIKGINVQLPKGLDSPIDNPLNSYDKCKNGIQKTRDSNITYERTYEKLCSYVSEGDSNKDIETEYRVMNDGIPQKGKRDSSDRNNSGESNMSGKCHDSISSSNTTKTHLSIDSGAEIDSPPSPDGFFSETSSTNTTPRSYKPDLAIVEESNGSNSKDSGLEKEVTYPMPLCRNTDIPSKFAWYVKKKNYPYSNIQFQKCGQIQPYSKFSVMESIPKYVPFGEQNLGLMDNHSLSNSEPSVADFDVGNDSEPLVIGRIGPYCKFGLARSAGNGLNVGNHTLAVNPNVGYSKFGIVYRALKYPEPGNQVPDFKGVEAKLVHHNPQILPVFHAPMVHVPVKASGILKPFMPHEKQGSGENLLKDANGAYSKIGIQPKHPQGHNGYVSFHDVLKKENEAESVPQIPCAAYSKISVDPADDTEMPNDRKVDVNSRLQDNQMSNGPGRSGYVTFQDAKVMNAAKIPLENMNETERTDFIKNDVDAAQLLPNETDSVDSGDDLLLNPLNQPKEFSDTENLLNGEHINGIDSNPVTTDNPIDDNKLGEYFSNGDVELESLSSSEDLNHEHKIVNGYSKKPSESVGKQTNGYVSYNDLKKESNDSAHVITRPNTTYTVQVENV